MGILQKARSILAGILSRWCKKKSPAFFCVKCSVAAAAGEFLLVIYGNPDLRYT
jgi:hypothetical protein